MRKRRPRASRISIALKACPHMPESAVPAAAMIAVDAAADAMAVAVADAAATTVDAADGKDCSEK